MSATLPASSVDTLLTDFDREFDEAIRHELDADSDADADGLRGEQRTTVSLSPTAWAFVQDREGFILVAEGARRVGKSTAALARILRVASEVDPHYLPVKVACVRDTWVNLARSVHETIRQGEARGWWDVEWAAQDTECVLNRAVHFYFFGMDRPADANKFQSFECGVLWLEEPAPAADLASGIPIEVLAMGISSLSQAGVPNHCILSMNPPNDTHWTVELLDALDAGQDDVLRVSRPGEAPIRVKRYWFPPDENKHIPPGYHLRLRAVLEAAGRLDLVQRLVEGQRGSVKLGVPVTPDFVEIQHVAPEALPLNPRWPAWRSFDFGSTPACVLAQTTPSGHLYVVGALETPEGAAMGIEQFIAQLLIPWMGRFGIRTRPSSDRERAKPYFKFRDVGDPAGQSREASNSERTAARSLEALLGTSFEGAPVAWSARRDSMAYVLRQVIGKTRLVQIDPDEGKPLIKSLAGGWHRHRTPAGVISEQPVKNHRSHVGDAFGYLCAVLYPVAEALEKLARGTDVARPRTSAANVPWWAR